MERLRGVEESSINCAINPGKRVKLFVISLARFPERAAFMRAGLDRLGLSYEIFPAIDGSRGEHQAVSRYDESACLRRFGAPLGAAEIGCFTSHFLLWQKCVQMGEPITILEDDVELSPGFPEAFGLAAERIGQHRLIRLAGYFNRPSRTIETLGEKHRLVRFLRGPAGTQCYCLSPDAAAALLAASSGQWTEPVDLFVDRFWYHGVESKGLLPFEAREVDRRSLPQAIGERMHPRKGLAKLRREWSRLADLAARNVYNLTHG